MTAKGSGVKRRSRYKLGSARAVARLEGRAVRCIPLSKGQCAHKYDDAPAPHEWHREREACSVETCPNSVCRE